MAKALFSLFCESVAQAADSNPHTILQVATTATCQIAVHAVFIGLAGTSVTDKAILFRLLYQTTAGTAGTATALKNTDGRTVAANSTGLFGVFTAEPTAGNEIWAGTIQGELNGGFWVPLGKEIIVNVSSRLGLVAVNSSANANAVTATFNIEE